MPQPFRNQSGIAATIAAVLVTAQFVALGIVRPLWRPDPYSDFATFYSAAQCFRVGTDPYDPQALRATGGFDGWVGRYFYPPPFAAVAVRPLTSFEFATARRIWVGVEVVSYVAAAWITAGIATPLAGWYRVALVIGLALPFAPVFLDLRLGSVSGLLWLLVALGWRARARGRPRRAGLYWGLAVLLKLFPVWLLVYCAMRRERRLVVTAGVAAAAVVVASLPLTGFAVYRTFCVEVVPTLFGESFAWFTNQSLDAFFWRLFVPNSDTTPWIASPLLHRIATTAATVAILALVVRAARRAGAIGSAADSLAFTTVLAASPLVSRVAWEYLFVLTLPAFFVWAGRALANNGTRAAFAGIALAWWLLAAPFAYEHEPLRSGWGLLRAAPRTAGAVLLVAISSQVLWRARRRRDSA